MGEPSETAEQIVYEPDASQATPEVDRTRERPPWVVTIVAWVVTIVALVVAAVSVTLLLTDDGPGGAGDPEPTPAGATIPAIQTVEANVMCQVFANEPVRPQECAEDATQSFLSHCANPNVEAVVVTFYPGGVRWGTVVCNGPTPNFGAFFGGNEPDGEPGP